MSVLCVVMLENSVTVLNQVNQFLMKQENKLKVDGVFSSSN